MNGPYGLGFLAVSLTPNESLRRFDGYWIPIAAFANLMLSILIGVRLIHHKKRYRETLGESQTNNFAGTFAFVIDTTLPYAIFGVVAGIFAVVPSLKHKAGVYTIETIWQCLGVSFVFDPSYDSC